MILPHTRAPLRTQRALVALALLGTAFAAPTVRAETWAARLGYPEGQKVILLQTREMGLCYATNAADEQLWSEGVRHSSAAMAPCPWFADYVDRTRDYPKSDVGLTLTLNSEWPRYRWQPLAHDDAVASLVDQQGYLWTTTTQTLVSAAPADVESELHAQILHANLAGMRPTHLTTHLGTLYSRADLVEVYLKLAQSYWIPAVIIELTPDQLDRFRSMGFPLPDELVAAVQAYPLPKLDDLQFVESAESYEAKKAAFLELVDGLQPGLTSIALHPAVDEPALRRIVDNAEQRVWDLQLLVDPDIRDRLNAADVTLTTWQEIMDRFEGRVPPGDSVSGATSAASAPRAGGAP